MTPRRSQSQQEVPGGRSRRLARIAGPVGLALIAATVAPFLLVDDLPGKLAYRWMLMVHAATRHLPDHQESGRQLYELHCSSCHGSSANGGRGPSLKRLLAQPETGTHDLMQAIRWGKRDGGMPPYEKILSKQQVLQVIAHLQSLGGQQGVKAPPGNPRRGEILVRERGGCLACHSIGAEGASFGPSLDGVGRLRGIDYLRQKLLSPQADVSAAYRPVLLLTRSGKAVNGFVVGEDTFTVQIRDMSAHLHSFQKSDVEDLRVELGKSFMPSYAGVFTDDELGDIVAFLANLDHR